MSDLRIPFMDTLMDLAEKDKRIVMIVPDVGFKHADKFKERFPNRYFNFGVTEQATMIIAAAMALDGYKPYVYSMINFVVFRPYEMVRNAVCYHNANVKILGVSGSAAYAFLGFSHNIEKDEDLKVLKGLPNLKTYTPKTDEEVVGVISDTYKMDNPCYIRL